MPEIPPDAALALLEPTSAELAVLARVEGDQDPRRVYLASLTTPKSQRSMAAALERIARLVNTHADVLPWQLLRYQHTQAIRAALIGQFAPATTNQALAALRGVLREASRLGLLSAEELGRAIDLKPAKGSREPTGRALSAAELRALVEACDASTAQGARDAALVAVVYNCGLRRAEAVGTNLADYHPTEAKLLVRGKGNKERTVYVTAAAALLDRWVARRGDAPGPLFLPIDKADRIGTRRLTDQAVLYLFHRLGERARVALFSPHDLRRTFIGDLLDAGADISVVQQLAGHAQVTTTQRYDRRGESAKKKAAGLLRL